MSNVLEGHQKSCVTLICMCLPLVKVNDCYTCSIMVNVFLGVEKNNDDAKRHYFSGNSHNAARDILTEATELSTLNESL